MATIGRKWRAPRTLAAFAGVLLFAFFSVVSVERERRTAEREGLVAPRPVSSTMGRVRWSDENVFVPFGSPRAQAAADRAVVEFLRTIERRPDSPELRATRRAQILDARRRFASVEAVEERRVRRIDDARTAARTVETFLSWASERDDGESSVFSAVDGAASNVFSASCVFSERSANGDERERDGDSDLAAAAAFLAELSEEPAATSVPLAPLAELNDSGDFRDAAVFLDANAILPAPVAVETIVANAAPRTFAVVGTFQVAFALFGAFGARFFCVDWARFFSIWGRRRTGRVLGAFSRRFVFSFESFGATRTLAELAVVRLLN